MAEQLEYAAPDAVAYDGAVDDAPCLEQDAAEHERSNSADKAPARRLRVLIHGLNYAPDFVGVARYTTDMAEWMAARGHEVWVETAPPYYPAWKTAASYPGDDGAETVMNGVRVNRRRIYVPARPTGARRILHYASWFGASAIGSVRRARRIRPDVVIAIAPSLLGAPAAWMAARASGAPCMLHLQDLEVEAAFAAGHLTRERLPGLATLGLGVERRILGLFDAVSSISPEMVAAVRRKGVPAERLFEFRNWVDLETITPKPPGASPYRERFGLADDDVLCLYAGVLAAKQGLHTVVETARHMQSDRRLVFAICGDGPMKPELEALAADLPNVSFHPFAPDAEYNDLMAAADIHLLPQIAEAANLVLPSKLTAMLASGRPVIAGAMHGTGLAREVDGCGVCVAPEDPDAFANAIRMLANDPTRRRIYGAKARQRAAQVWSKDRILPRFEHRLLRLAARGVVAQEETLDTPPAHPGVARRLD